MLILENLVTAADLRTPRLAAGPLNDDNFCHIRHTASFRHAKSPVFMRLLAVWRNWRTFYFFTRVSDLPLQIVSAATKSSMFMHVVACSGCSGNLDFRDCVIFDTHHEPRFARLRDGAEHRLYSHHQCSGICFSLE
jgi:hypothetical protein